MMSLSDCLLMFSQVYQDLLKTVDCAEMLTNMNLSTEN